MELYFLGNYVGKEMFVENEIIFNAGMKWQFNLVNSLKKNYEIKVYTELKLPFFPKIKYLFLPTKKQININKNKSNLLKYVNLPVIREIIISIQIFLLFLLKRITHKKNKVLQYNLDLEFALPLFILSKMKILEYIPIVVDLYPEKKINYFKLKSYFKFFSFKIQTLILKNTEKTIIINENIGCDFNLKNYLLIEGGVSKEDCSIKKIRKDKRDKIIIVFTGTLDLINGVDFLINTLRKVKCQNYELHLYGTGLLVEFVKNEEKKNKKIKYMGYKKNEEILKIQKEANFLIIPRRKSILDLRYTFPSKIFEYMLSETPIICTNIPGLSEEYKENLFIADTENEREFAKIIDEILTINENKLKEKSKKAKEFIIKNKNWDIQAKKIINFVYEK